MCGIAAVDGKWTKKANLVKAAGSYFSTNMVHYNGELYFIANYMNANQGLNLAAKKRQATASRA